MTETELNDIAAAAIMGESSCPTGSKRDGPADFDARGPPDEAAVGRIGI